MHAATRLDRSGWAFALALACIYGPSASPGLTTGVAAAAFLIDAWANEMGNHYGGLSAADGRWPGSSLHPDTLIRCVWGCRRNIQARMPIRDRHSSLNHAAATAVTGPHRGIHRRR